MCGAPCLTDDPSSSPSVDTGRNLHGCPSLDICQFPAEIEFGAVISKALQASQYLRLCFMHCGRNDVMQHAICEAHRYEAASELRALVAVEISRRQRMPSPRRKVALFINKLVACTSCIADKMLNATM